MARRSNDLQDIFVLLFSLITLCFYAVKALIWIIKRIADFFKKSEKKIDEVKKVQDSEIIDKTKHNQRINQAKELGYYSMNTYQSIRDDGLRAKGLLRDEVFWEYFALEEDKKFNKIKSKPTSKDQIFIDIEERLRERKNKRCGES